MALTVIKRGMDSEQVVQRFEDLGRVVEQVADEDDEPAARDAFGDLVEDRCEVGLAAGFGLV